MAVIEEEQQSPSIAKPKLTDEERDKLADKLDKELDDFINVLAEKSKSSDQKKEPFDFDKFYEELDHHPAFMRDLKPNENGEYSEAVQALQSLKYDESADDDAEHARTEGNKYFKHKKYRWARDAYTNGIKLKCQDSALNSVLYGNRAAAQKHLGNLASAVRDCMFAIKFNAENLKAALRGAECLLELGYAQRCLDWNGWINKQLVNVNCDTDEFKKFTSEMDPILQKANGRVKAEERDERRRKLEERKIEQEKRALFAAFKERQLNFTPPIDLNNADDFEFNEVCIRSPYTKELLQERVYVDFKDNGSLVWPVLLVYVASAQTDMIKECSERSTLSDLFAPVFAQPAPWDEKNFDYKLDNIRFFLPLDVFDDRQLEEISLNQTLRQVISTKDHYITQGLPTIHVYTKQKASEELEKLDSKRYRLR